MLINNNKDCEMSKSENFKILLKEITDGKQSKLYSR